MPISTDDIAQRMTAETKEVEKGNTIPMCCVKDTRFILAAKKEIIKMRSLGNIQPNLDFCFIQDTE